MAQGQAEAAARHASDVLAAEPDHAEACHIKGVALLAAGRLQEATGFLAKARDLAPQEPLVHMYLGIAQAMAGHFEASLSSLREATRLSPGLAEAQINLGITLLKLERWAEAAEAFQRTLALQPDYVPALDGLGIALVAQERFEQAVGVLRQTVSLAPKLASAHSNLAKALFGLGKREQGLPALRRAAELKPRNRRITLNLALGYMDTHRPAEATAVYEKLLRLAPDWAEGVASYANALEKQNRSDEARPLAQRALELDPGNTVAGLALLRLHLRAEENRQAVELAQSLLARELPRGQRQNVQFELGRGLERLERYDEAFEAFSAGQETAALSPKMRNANRSRHPDLIERSRACFDAEVAKDWPRTFDDGLAAPVFFIGFPRSGTTLVERMLKAHPSFVTAEEFPWLENTAARASCAYPEGLGDLPEAELRALRRLYFEQVDRDLGEDRNGRVLVDKHPLNTLHLGFVRRIFPESKVLFALRDPRDVVLSCFTQTFRGSDAMAHFLELETSARFYAQVMDLWFQLRDNLGLETMTYRYEDLTRDPESLAREMLAFLEVDWHPDVLRHHEKSEGAYIRTSSRESVTHAIHGKAVLRWRNYQRQLAPVLPILQPYIEALGYEPSA